MTYKAYITTSATQAQAFADSVLTMLGDFVANAPEAAGSVAEISGNYVAQTAAAIPDMVANASYNTQRVIVTAASQLADAAGNLMANVPAYAGQFAEAAASYSLDAAAAAVAYLSQPERDNPIGYLHVDDTGQTALSVTGDGGESGGGGASGTWETDPDPDAPPPRYPVNVPAVPPQIVPKASPPQVRVVHQISAPEPGDCVGKRTPELGMVFNIDYFLDQMAFPSLIHVYWWDNIYCRRDVGGNGSWTDAPRQYFYFHAAPALPKTRIETLFPATHGGYWKCVNIAQNQVYQTPEIFEWYLAREWWDWTTRFYDSQGTLTGVNRRSGSQGWHECHTLELNWDGDHIGGPGTVLYPEGGGYISTGFGSGNAFTYSVATFAYCGNTQPDDWPTPRYAGYLPTLGAIEALMNNTIVTILGGRR